MGKERRVMVMTCDGVMMVMVGTLPRIFGIYMVMNENRVKCHLNGPYHSATEKRMLELVDEMMAELRGEKQ